MRPSALFWAGFPLVLTGVPVIQVADSPLWLLLGWVFTISGLACLLLATAGTSRVQRAIPALGSIWGVRDHAFRVLSARELAEKEQTLLHTENALAEAQAAPRPSTSNPQHVTFSATKARIESYIEEGRDLYAKLLGHPDPNQTGTLYDEIGDWSKRAYADLDAYHHTVASNFRQGGHIFSPQFDEIQPTDAETLKTYVRRRGQVLRNVLDGTPGKDLEWDD